MVEKNQMVIMRDLFDFLSFWNLKEITLLIKLSKNKMPQPSNQVSNKQATN